MDNPSLLDGETLTTPISISFDINQGEIKYKLNIEYDNNNIKFQISEEDVLNELYEQKLNMKDIRGINEIFSEFTYCQQLFDYINNQKENNYLELVRTSKNIISIKLKQKNIEINLYKKKASPDLIIKNLCEEISKLKNSIKSILLSIQKYKNFNEKIENIINEKIKTINEEIKRLQQEQKIDNNKEKIDKNIKLKNISAFNINNEQNNNLKNGFNIARLNKIITPKKKNFDNGHNKQIKKKELKNPSQSPKKKPLDTFQIKGDINKTYFLEKINENEFNNRQEYSFNNTHKKGINFYNYSTPKKNIKDNSHEDIYRNLNNEFTMSEKIINTSTSKKHKKNTRTIKINENNFYSKQNSSNSKKEKKNFQLNTINTTKVNRIVKKNFTRKNNIKDEKILHNIKYSIINKKPKDDVFGSSNKNNNNEFSSNDFNNPRRIQSKSSSNLIKKIIFNKNDKEHKKNSQINNLNALLLCFLNIKKFTNYFLANKDKMSISLKNDKKSLLIYFLEITENFNQKKCIKKNFLNNINNLIGESLKNDLGKLVEFIIISLHNELSANKNINPDFNDCFEQDFNLYYEKYEKRFKNNFKSIISEVFYFLYNTQIKCKKCKKNTDKIQFSYLLKFSLKKVEKFKEKSEDLTIKECFKYYQNYFENTCNNCKSKGNYLEKKILLKGPKVLIINLTEGKNIKFKLEEKINLSNYIFDKENKYVYELIGIVKDKDNKMFIPFFKNLKDHRWNKYDDGEIYFTSFERISHSGTPSSMLLFYLLVENEIK